MFYLMDNVPIIIKIIYILFAMIRVKLQYIILNEMSFWERQTLHELTHNVEWKIYWFKESEHRPHCC